MKFSVKLVSVLMRFVLEENMFCLKYMIEM